jgi:hypothetical protein
MHMRVGDQLGCQQLGRDEEFPEPMSTEDQPQGATRDADGERVVREVDGVLPIVLVGHEVSVQGKMRNPDAHSVCWLRY